MTDPIPMRMLDGKLVPPLESDAAQRQIDAAGWAADAARQRVARLWAEADNLAAAAFDHNSRAKALAWRLDPAIPRWRLDRINAIDAWMDLVWVAYFQAKADPTANALPPLPPCPYSFSDLLQE